MGRVQSCGCQECCNCYTLNVDSWDDDEWFAVWSNPDTPSGSEGVSFNGTELVIAIDSSAYDQVTSDRTVTIVNKRAFMEFNDARCPWRWGMQGLMECSQHVEQAHCTEYYPTISPVLYDPRRHQLEMGPSTFFNLRHSEQWEYRVHNLAETARYPSVNNLCLPGIMFRISPLGYSVATGVYEWKFQAPFVLKLGSCVMPKWNWAVGAADSVVTMTQGLGVLVNDTCSTCDGSNIYFPTSPPSGWEGPATPDVILNVGLQATQTEWSDGTTTMDGLGIGYATYDRPHPLLQTIPIKSGKPFCRDVPGECSFGGFIPGGGSYDWCAGSIQADLWTGFNGRLNCRIGSNDYHGDANQVVGIQSGDTITLTKTARQFPCQCLTSSSLSLLVR